MSVEHIVLPVQGSLGCEDSPMCNHCQHWLCTTRTPILPTPMTSNDNTKHVFAIHYILWAINFMA